MDTKTQYREFSRSEPSLPIFSRDWWLDATAGPDHWNAALVKKGGQVAAAMPYTTYRRYWLKVMGQPALTQKLGPWLRLTEGKPATRLAGEKDLMQGLIDQLPRFDYFTQNWHHSRTNWLPFAWNGFHQTTRYTYVLNQLQDADKLWAGFDNATRAECKKAQGRFNLTVRDDLPLDAFLALNRMTFARQRMEVPYSDAFVRRLDAACAERGCRKFFIAVDP
ncbi:MAG TPA: methicillin resistance protein, partial [Noviherbaspirillum sp.]|uniref:methicillin resistance protein n=1 Tax=Noviherbaspirillum sp. TaxID=1926288 RepID=UPI002DDD0655